MKTAFRQLFLWRPLLVFVLLLSAVLASGCNKNAADSHHGPDGDVDYYTCTMHPSVKAKEPGKCPICAMDLVPVAKRGGAKPSGTSQPQPGKSDKAAGMKDMKSSGDMQGMSGMPGMGGNKAATGGSESNEFMVPVERQQQIGVTYATVERQPMHHTIRSLGLIVPDRTRRWEFVSRVEGYVQKLDVTSPGQRVAKDQPLLSIYSPDLFASEREFVELLNSKDKLPALAQSSDRLIQSARRRLELWNVTPAQIAELEKSRQPSDTLNLLSPFRGVVEKVTADQGKKVMAGESLVAVTDLSVVWLWAEFYEDELTMLREGQTLDITAKSYPGVTFKGTISLIDPFVDEMKRTARVRVDIPNEGFRLRPGMYVNAELGMDMGEGLTIPVSAIMPTGMRSYVFVDKGQGKLEPRLVQLGAQYGDFYEVRSGLAQGERVVSSANFLIDAESKVQGALKGFEEPPTGEPSAERPGPMRVEQPGQPPMEMPAATPPPLTKPTMTEPMPLGPEARALYEPLSDAYLSIHGQLAQDKFDGVPEQAAKLRQQVEMIARSDVNPVAGKNAYRGWVGSLQQRAAKFEPQNIEEARVEFGELGLALVGLVTQFPLPLAQPLRGMHCPMWTKSPAYWLQVDKETENPFMGKAMLGCGSEVKSLAEVK